MKTFLRFFVVLLGTMSGVILGCMMIVFLFGGKDISWEDTLRVIAALGILIGTLFACIDVYDDLVPTKQQSSSAPQKDD